MSHIVECEITGLAGHQEKVAFTFDRHLNVFFGLNGSGKTSLLKILHSAMSLDARLLVSVPFRAAKVKIYTVTHNRAFTLTIDREDLEKTNPPPSSSTETLRQRARRMERTLAKTSWSWRYTDPIPEVKDTKRWVHRYLPTTRLYLSPTGILSHEVPLELSDPDATTATYSEESLERLFATSMMYLWQTHASEIFSGVRQAQEAGLANILRDVLVPADPHLMSATPIDRDMARRRVETFLHRRGYRDLPQIMAHFDSQFELDPRVRQIVGDINTVETTIEQAMSPLQNLSNLLSSLYSGGKSVQVSERGINVLLASKAPLELDLLSSGEKHVLRILVEALFSAESSLMIDEPELSLHVDWQRSLLKHLRTLNSNAQLIVATHSPEIMADVPDENIFRL